jgi:alkanesulfonate monooxygenase SsuD/methylene tetrahydromethanopterin reductase-like flavin-dependent oxidoreductase (luciferase family)
LSLYEQLFEEKLNLFVELLKGEPVTWSGRLRAALSNQPIYPPSESGTIKTWVAVGGSPESVVRAAYYGLPLMLAIIGGSPKRFAPWAELYRERLERFNKPLQPIGVHSPGHVAETDDLAREQLYPHHLAMMNRIGAERGWPPSGAREFEHAAGPDGAVYVGSPKTVARKIVATVKTLGLSRFDLKYSNGTLPHDLQMRSLELYGTKVVPMVRDLLATSAND